MLNPLFRFYPITLPFVYLINFIYFNQFYIFYGYISYLSQKRSNALDFLSLTHSTFCINLILHFNLLPGNQRIGYRFVRIKIFIMHIYSRNLTVLICGIIIDTFIRVTATAVNCNLILSVSHMNTSALLFYRS